MVLKLFKRKKESGIGNLILNKTHNIPEIKFNLNGVLELRGKLIPEDATSLFEVLIDWVKKIKVENVEFNSKLEYINTISTQKLFLLLKEIENNIHVQNIVVNWYYEMNDPESKELGELIATNLDKCIFKYLECKDLEELE
jgi:hypothetical protein